MVQYNLSIIGLLVLSALTLILAGRVGPKGKAGISPGATFGFGASSTLTPVLILWTGMLALRGGGI